MFPSTCPPRASSRPCSRRALLEAQGPGFDAEARLAELRRHLTATGSAGAGGGGTGGAGPSSGSGAATAAFETELLMSEYIALREATSNMRADSREDRLAVIDLALAAGRRDSG